MILQTWCGSHVDTQNKHWTVYFAWATGWLRAILRFWEYKKWYDIRRRIQSGLHRIIFDITIPVFLGRVKWGLKKISTGPLWVDHNICIHVSAYHIGMWIILIGRVEVWNLPVSVLTDDIPSSLDDFVSKFADMVGVTDIASDFLRGFSDVSEIKPTTGTTL